jgi:hypothetical protein
MTKCFDCDEGPCYMNCGPVDRSATIHTAYAMSRRNGTTYRARAYVADRGTKHSFTIGIGDTPEEATADAVRYVKAMHERDGVPAPTKIVEHGKLAGAFVDASAF